MSSVVFAMATRFRSLKAVRVATLKSSATRLSVVCRAEASRNVALGVPVNNLSDVTLKPGPLFGHLKLPIEEFAGNAALITRQGLFREMAVDSQVQRADELS